MELEAIVLKCLEKLPTQRYSSARALADDLKRYLAGAKPMAPELTPRRRLALALHKHRNGLRWAGAAVLLALIAIGLVAALRPAPLPPEPDPREVIERQLAAGKPVTLIGPKGKPAWHEWILGSPEFVESPLVDGACSYESIDYAMFDLCRNPVASHYRLRAELRYVNTRIALSSTSYVGIYFGRSSRKGSNGVAAHSYFSVNFNDFPQTSETMGHVRFDRILSIEEPNATAGALFSMLKHTQYPLPMRQPAPWRPVEIEVSSDRLRVYWPDAAGKMTPFVDWTGEQVRAEYLKQRKKLLNPNILAGHGIELPEWDPRLPLGVCSFSAAVAVRNVVLTPLE